MGGEPRPACEKYETATIKRRIVTEVPRGNVQSKSAAAGDEQDQETRVSASFHLVPLRKASLRFVSGSRLPLLSRIPMLRAYIFRRSRHAMIGG